MIKLILIAFLSFALSGQVYGHSTSSSGEDVREAEEWDADCQVAGSAKIKLSINVPPGGCGCPSDEDEEKEDLCLGLDNSKKISDALLNILDWNDHSYDVIEALQITQFMNGMEYNDFSDNIKNNDFPFAGFAELKELVQMYKICKKECQVYFTLRKTLRENAAVASTEESVNVYGTLDFIVKGDLVILSDSIKEIQEQLVRESQYTDVIIKAKTFIADVNLMRDVWHGKHLRIEATNFLIGAKTVLWDLESCKY